MTLDPYAELGVPRDADDASIKSAYRKRARKTHPDRGGKREEFERAANAVAILRDPARRARFDRTGETEEPNIDRIRIGALQAIELFLQKVVNDYVSTRDSKLDPRKLDLVRAFEHVTKGTIDELDIGVRQIGRNIAFLTDMRDRFSVDGDDDPIRRSFDRQIESNKAQKESAKEQMEIHRRAIVMMNKYRFSWDRPPAPASTSSILFDDYFIPGSFR